MTAMPAERPSRLVDLSAEELRPVLDDAVDVYVTAMRYPPGAARQRGPVWMEHMLRAGWRCTAALRDERLVGIAYGYRGAPGQWWHDEVRRGLLATDPGTAQHWLSDYFELTELHVHPDAQGHGIGSALLHRLLSRTDAPKVMLSTPEGPTRAWRLYRSIGFGDLLRDYRFTGDPRPFAVLGRSLPL